MIFNVLTAYAEALVKSSYEIKIDCILPNTLTHWFLDLFKKCFLLKP